MNNKNALSDEHLIHLARAGEMDAYNLLLSRYTNKIRQMINVHIQDRANTYDLTQEVLLKIYCNLSYFNEECLFSTWLYRITQNTIKNYYRTTETRVDLESTLIADYEQATSQSPESALICNELGEQLELALSLLSEELRTCYGMHHFDGQSYEDIAKKMACPIGTVRSRIFRARKLLMSSINGLGMN